MKLSQMLTDSFSGLVNYVTGTGTARDKITHARWQFERPQDQQLLALYRSTWIARKLVDIPIADMLREGWRWQADEADITKLEEEERRLGVAQKLKEALTRDAVFGGGALILGDGTADTAQPLLPESIGQGGLQYLIVAGRGELTVKELVRVPGVDYSKPAMFELLPLQGRALQIHPTRVITFNAMPIPAPLGVLGEQDFWGDSRLAAVLRDIAAAMSGVAGTGRLMEELAITYHKIAGFTEKMAEKGGEEQVRRVISLMNQMKSSVQAVPIDKDDDIEVITASFAGIPEALRSLMQNVSGAGDIPLTRFLGSSPDGMNATGASDTRNYYDRLAGERQADIVPAMDYLDQFLIPSALGHQDDSVRRVWNPLWQLSEVEQVDLDAKKIKIMTDTNTAGIVHDHVLEQVTRTIMIDSPTFQGAEKAFEEADEMPDPEPEEVEEANQLQAGGGQQPLERPRLQVVGDSGDLEDWDIEDVKSWMSQSRHPAGSSKGGQWSGGASQSNYGPKTPEGWKPPVDAPKPRRSNGKKAAGPDREKVRALAEQRDAAAAAVANKQWSQEEVFHKLQGQITSEVAKSPDFPETRNPAKILTPQAEVTREMRQELRGWSENGYGYSQGVTAAFENGSAAGPVERAIDNFKASQPFTTYRGTQGDFAESILSMKPGDTLRENSPVSTSYDSSMASNYAGTSLDKGVIMAIRVREGDTAAPTYSFAGYTKSEKEVTLPRGTTYKVIEVDREARTAVVEIIQQPVIRDGKAYMEDSAVTLDLDWLSVLEKGDQ